MPEFMPQTPMQALVARTLKDAAGNSISKRAGYTYINGSMIPNALSALPARAIRAGRIVRAGVGATEKFVASIDPKAVNNVTAQIQTNVGVRVRSIKDGTNPGTEGNDGMINLKPKIVPSTTPFNIPLLQLEDQPFFFPQMQLETMLFDEAAETIANYLDNTDNGMDSYHMAKALAYAMWRAANNSQANVITLNKSKVYEDTYMIQMINELNSKLANGDSETKLMTFTGPREIAARPELIGYLKTPKTGFILNSDISTRMLYDPNFDIREAERVGTQYRGNIQGYELQEAPQGIFTLIEKWFGLAAGALNGVLGIVFTPQAYAMGGVGKKEMKMLQSSEHDGVVAFPYIKYGGTSYRIQYIIAYDDWTIPDALKNAAYPAPVKAPTEWYPDGFEPIQKVIYDADGNPVGYDTVADVLKPNGNLGSVVNLTVLGTAGAAVTNALVSVTNGSTPVAVTNNVDGTYTFIVPKGSTPSVTIAATGYTSQTFSLTKANTAKDNFAVTKTLVAS